MEKLEIMIKLVSERNVEQVLLELKEYATEVDVDFVGRVFLLLVVVLLSWKELLSVVLVFY